MCGGYLLGLDKETLVSLLLEQADEDERLHRKLTLRAAQAQPGGVDLSVWKETLDNALEVDDYVHYHGAYDYAGGIGEVIESLEDLLRGGQAEAVIGLAEHGLDAVEESLEHVEDFDGYMGDLLRRLQELHLEACRVARPDPVDLAERLFEAEMDSDYDTFHRAALAYADILGETGLAAYRRLAEADWAKIPALALATGIRTITAGGSGLPRSWKPWQELQTISTPWWPSNPATCPCHTTFCRSPSSTRPRATRMEHSTGRNGAGEPSRAHSRTTGSGHSSPMRTRHGPAMTKPWH